MPKVIFIVGMARSGTTLLSLLLDRMDGFVALGEAHVYWEIAESERRCGCGRRIDVCPLWGDLRGAQDEWGVDAEAMRDVFRALARPRVRTEWRRHGSRHGGAAGNQPAAYADATNATYRWLAQRTGAEILVDSSKLPAVADLTARTAEMEVHLVHLVRDPRAVAHSMGRRSLAAALEDPPITAPARYLRAALGAAADWTLRNAYVEAHLRRRAGRRFLRLRFEDLADSPRQAVAKVREFAGAGPTPDGFLDERTVELGENHVLTGDQSRFRRGEIPVTHADAWRAEMPTLARIAVTLITLPLLLLYGYPLRGLVDPTS